MWLTDLPPVMLLMLLWSSPPSSVVSRGYLDVVAITAVTAATVAVLLLLPLILPQNNASEGYAW